MTLLILLKSVNKPERRKRRRGTTRAREREREGGREREIIN